MLSVDRSPTLSRRFLLGLGLNGFVSLFGAQGERVRLCGIEFERLRNGKSLRRYLFLHGNETTAREVLRQHLRKHRGSALLVTGAEREVEIQGAKLDPNRMFSRVGAEANLLKLTPELPRPRLEGILDFLDAGREELLAQILPPPGGLLIVLHNNRNGYSVNDELPISDDVWLPRKDEPHQFLLATDPRDFAILRQSPFNAVLQNSAPKEDDGSLSRLAARRRVRYVNLEVFLGREDDQRRMLAWMEAHLPQKYR
jgi:hypothetical protein